MFGKHKSFVSKATVSACMYFLVMCILCIERFWTFICATMLARFRVCCQFHFTVLVYSPDLIELVISVHASRNISIHTLNL
jgi:hypothetical protein